MKNAIIMVGLIGCFSSCFALDSQQTANNAVDSKIEAERARFNALKEKADSTAIGGMGTRTEKQDESDAIDLSFQGLTSDQKLDFCKEHSPAQLPIGSLAEKFCKHHMPDKFRGSTEQNSVDAPTK